MVNKVKRAMHEFKHGELHSGSSTGPRVKSRKQAIAIGLAEQRKATDPDNDGDGYADGGLIESARDAVSHGIEAISRAAGTERGKMLDAADRAAGPDKRKGTASSMDDEVMRMQRGYSNGGLVRNRSNSGAYAEGGTVIHDRTDHGPKTLSEGAKSAFRLRSRGRM